MKELTVKIKYTDATTDFKPVDVKRAMQNLFGINVDFEVTEIEVENKDEVRLVIH